MDDEQDICERYHGGDSASQDAFDFQGPEARRAMRLRIFQLIRARGTVGATCDELEALLGFSHQTCSARCSELKRDGWVKPNGTRRRTRSGATAKVLVVAVKQKELFEVEAVPKPPCRDSSTTSG